MSSKSGVVLDPRSIDRALEGLHAGILLYNFRKSPFHNILIAGPEPWAFLSSDHTEAISYLKALRRCSRYLP